MRSHVRWRGERNIPYKKCGNVSNGRVLKTKPLSNRDVLKLLGEAWKGKPKRGQYVLSVDLDCYK